MKTQFILAAVLGVALLGCGNEVVDGVEEFADRACKCQDSACADDVHARFLEFYAKNQNNRGTKGERDQVEQATKKMNACIMKVQQRSAVSEDGATGKAADGTAPAPVTPPAAGQAAGVPPVPPGEKPPEPPPGGEGAPAGGTP